jgi:hypothetical protein
MQEIYLLWGFLPKFCVNFCPSHACRMPLPSHPVCYDRPNNVWRNVHIVELSCRPVWLRTEEFSEYRKNAVYLMHYGANCFGEVKNTKLNLREDNPSVILDSNLGPSDMKQKRSATRFHEVQQRLSFHQLMHNITLMSFTSIRISAYFKPSSGGHGNIAETIHPLYR